jgi:hypothetical protein
LRGRKDAAPLELRGILFRKGVEEDFAPLELREFYLERVEEDFAPLELRGILFRKS